MLNNNLFITILFADCRYIRVMRSSKITIVFKAVISLLILWGVVLTFFVISDKENSFTIEVPADYDELVVINSSKVLTEALGELVVNEQYQPLYNKLINTAKERLKEPSQEKLGFDPLQPALLVTKKDKGETYRYVILRVTNKNDFLSFAEKTGLRAKVKDNKGFLFTSDAYTVAPEKFKSKEVNAGQLISYFSDNGEFQVELKEDKLVLSGEIAAGTLRPLKYLPKNDGLLLQLPFQMPAAGMEKLSAEWKDLLGNIRQFAIDYKGIEFQNKGLYPNANAVFSVSPDFNVNMLKTLAEQAGIKWIELRTDDYRLLIADKKYSLKRLSADEWFLGTDLKAVQENTQQQVSAVVGIPSSLTKVEGGFLVSAGLGFIPGFAPTKQYLDKMEQIDIRYSLAGDKIICKGKLQFKDERNVALETLGYILEMSEVRK